MDSRAKKTEASRSGRSRRYRGCPWYIRIGIASSAVLLLVSLFMLAYSFMGLAKSQAAFESLAARVADEQEPQEPQEPSEPTAPMESPWADTKNSSPYAMLKEENSDLFGWVKIEGTQLNYPVMYTPWEPEYYLRRAFDKSDSISGIPFLDGRYTETGNHYLIYGHNMKNGTMFRTLLDYAKPEFWEEHPSITFDTMQESSTYSVIGAFYSRVYFQDQTDVFRFYAYPDLSDPAVFSEYVDHVMAASLYETGETAEYGDSLLTLATCSYHTENGRFVVVARKD